MKLVANKPCTLSGKRYFIGEEIPAEAVTDPVALEKMGVLTVIRDGIPVETLEEWNACSSVMIHSNVFRYFVTSNRIMIDKCYHKEVENVVFRYFWSNI